MSVLVSDSIDPIRCIVELLSSDKIQVLIACELSYMGYHLGFDPATTVCCRMF